MNDRANLPALVSVSIPSLQMAESELIAVLQNSIYPGASEPSCKLVIGYCRSMHLDPMTKPVHIVPMRVKVKETLPNGKVKQGSVQRDVIMPGIELYRIKAARTGEYVGMDEAQWGPNVDEELGGEFKEEWDDSAQCYVKSNKTWDKVKVRYPEWCQITVYRLVAGEPRRFFSGRVYWKESYATAANGTSLPNAMWMKRAFGQLEKCAEALALRRGFPEIGAQPTIEEMEGKTIDAGATIDGATGAVVPTIPGPQAKSAARAEPARTPATVEGESAREPDPPAAEQQQEAGAAPAEGGAEPKPDKPMLESQLRIVRAKLKNVALSEADLIAQFGKVEELKFSQFDAVQAWIAEKGAKVAG
jgi:phage recombination protein Bet